MSWILNYFNKEPHDSVVYHDMTKGMWNELEKRFAQGSGLRILEN